MKRLCQFRKDEDGATAIEYGVLAMVFVIGLALLHQSRDNASRVLDGFTAINQALDGSGKNQVQGAGSPVKNRKPAASLKLE